MTHLCHISPSLWLIDDVIMRGQSHVVIPLVTWPGSSSISLVWRHILAMHVTPEVTSRLTAVDLGVTRGTYFRLSLLTSGYLYSPPVTSFFVFFDPIWPLAWPHVTPFELGTLLFIPRPNRLFFKVTWPRNSTPFVIWHYHFVYSGVRLPPTQNSCRIMLYYHNIYFIAYRL